MKLTQPTEDDISQVLSLYKRRVFNLAIIFLISEHWPSNSRDYILNEIKKFEEEK